MLTPDDEARLRPNLQRASDPDYERELTGQARPNVLFEAGMALVSHRHRTILLQIGNVKPFSDVAGRHILHLDGSTQKRQELANRLRTAGCPVNLNGTDWHTAGNLGPITRTGNAEQLQTKAELADTMNMPFEASPRQANRRTIVLAIRTALSRIEHWRGQNVGNLAAIHELPATIDLVPENASEAVSEAGYISDEASADLNNGFESLRLAKQQLEVMRDAKMTSPQLYQSRSASFLQHLTDAEENIKFAKEELRETGVM